MYDWDFTWDADEVYYNCYDGAKDIFIAEKFEIWPLQCNFNFDLSQYTYDTVEYYDWNLDGAWLSYVPVQPSWLDLSTWNLEY